LEAKQRGIELGIQSLILDNLEERLSKQKILEKLQKRFDLTSEQAKQYFEKFGKQ